MSSAVPVVGIVVKSASSPLPPSDSVTGEPGLDYFATAAHYRAVAGRVLSAIQGGRPVLVIGDRLSLTSMSAALREAADRRFTVVEVTSEREMAGHLTAGLLPPLFLFEEADRLADNQIDRICEAVAEKAAWGAAGVLLARSAFVDRLEQPSLQSLRDALAARLRFDELDDSETVDFLRHQLETRPRDSEERERRPILRRTLLGLAIVLTTALGALLAVRGVQEAGRHNSAPGNGASVTTPPAPAEQSRPAPAVPPPPAAPAPPQSTAAAPAPRGPTTAAPASPPSTAVAPAQPPSTAAAPAPPQPTAAAPTSSPSTPAAPTSPPSTAAAPASPRSTAAAPTSPPSRAAAPAPPQPTTAAPATSQSPAAQRPPTPEIAALVTRGDASVSSGDIASARLFYERAAEAGDAAAALRLGATYDPGFLGRAGVRGTPGDPAQAAFWYGRARDLGAAAAAERLKTLGKAAR